MKLVKGILATLISLSASSAFAKSTCYIYVAGTCSAHSEVKLNEWFTDDYNGSGSTAGICLHRAAEYRAYCAMPPEKNQYVNAAFFKSGDQMSVAQQFRGGGDPVSTFGPDWDPIITKY